MINQCVGYWPKIVLTSQRFNQLFTIVLQSSRGKDVTLHVSATNPAVHLYHKFGFKVQEFVGDFYDKYYPADSNECRHAFVMRLTR